MAGEEGEMAVRLGRRVRHRAVAGDGVLVHLERGQVMVVTEVGLRVVELLHQGPRTVPELVASIVGEFEVDEDTARRDLELFLAQLRGEQVLEGVATAAAASAGK
ncbi:MAG: PqqD family protein [Acidobacteriota bacterium]|jgi:hypothetical protein